MTVQRQGTSAVTERYQDAFVGSAMENGTTMIQFALRQHDFHEAWGTAATLCWRQASYHVDVHALSTFHTPMPSRCIVAQGAYGHDQDQRRECTPTRKGVSPSQPMSHSGIRLAGYLAVVCGVSLRPIALLFAGLCLIPMTKSSMKRWMDAMGTHVPTPEAMLRQLRALTPATECHMDGSSPWGTDHGVLVGQEEQDRILMTQEVASEHGAEARPWLQHVKDLGLPVPAACADSSQSCTEAIKAGLPQARVHADHFQTVTHSWGHLKKSLLSYRRKGKASGTEKNDAPRIAMAKPLGTWRWSLLKKPANLSGGQAGEYRAGKRRCGFCTPLPQ